LEEESVGRQCDLGRGLKIPLKGVLSGKAPVLRRFDTCPGGRLESPHTVIAVGLQERLQFPLQLQSNDQLGAKRLDLVAFEDLTDTVNQTSSIHQYKGCLCPLDELLRPYDHR
jgi:hypothetical protein